jgi:exoribonuclease II
MTIEVGSSLDESAQDQSCIQYWTKMDFPEDFSDDHCSTRAQTVFCLVVVSGTIDLDGDLSRRYFSNFGHPTLGRLLFFSRRMHQLKIRAQSNTGPWGVQGIRRRDVYRREHNRAVLLTLRLLR